MHSGDSKMKSVVLPGTVSTKRSVVEGSSVPWRRGHVAYLSTSRPTGSSGLSLHFGIPFPFPATFKARTLLIPPPASPNVQYASIQDHPHPQHTPSTHTLNTLWQLSSCSLISSTQLPPHQTRSSHPLSILFYSRFCAKLCINLL